MQSRTTQILARCSAIALLLAACGKASDPNPVAQPPMSSAALESTSNTQRQEGVSDFLDPIRPPIDDEGVAAYLDSLKDDLRKAGYVSVLEEVYNLIAVHHSKLDGDLEGVVAVYRSGESTSICLELLESSTPQCRAYVPVSLSDEAERSFKELTRDDEGAVLVTPFVTVASTAVAGELRIESMGERDGGRGLTDVRSDGPESTTVIGDLGLFVRGLQMVFSSEAYGVPVLVGTGSSGKELMLTMVYADDSLARAISLITQLPVVVESSLAAV